MRKEVGGTPEERPHAYAARSAASQVRRIARLGGPAPAVVVERRPDRVRSGAPVRTARARPPARPANVRSGGVVRRHLEAFAGDVGRLAAPCRARRPRAPAARLPRHRGRTLRGRMCTDRRSLGDPAADRRTGLRMPVAPGRARDRDGERRDRVGAVLRTADLLMRLCRWLRRRTRSCAVPWRRARRAGARADRVCEPAAPSCPARATQRRVETALSARTRRLGERPASERGVARPYEGYAATSRPCSSREGPNGQPPHRVGVHYLAFTHPAARGLRQRRASRRGRKPDPLAARRWAFADDRRRARRSRALRVVPLALAPPSARRRLLADPRDALRRCSRRPLPAGVVRARAPSEGAALTSFVRVDRRWHRMPAVTPRSGLAPGRLELVVPARTSPTIFVCWSAPPSRSDRSHDRSRDLRVRPREGRRATGASGCRRAATHRRSRATRVRDAAREPARPEPRARLALQHRQPVPAVLVPGGARRRAGHGGVRASRTSPARSCARSLSTPRGAVPELEAGAEARRDRRALPALRRPRVIAAELTPGAASWRRGARTPARSGDRRPSRGASATRPTSPISSTGCTRRPSSGRGCARWASVWSTDRASARSPAGAGDSPRGSRPAFGAPSARPRARLPDGSLFVPVRLLDDERAVRLGDGVARRQLLEPRRAVRARLGPLRARAVARRTDPPVHARATGRACSGSFAPARTRSTGGTRPIRSRASNQVYGLNVARFLADNDRPDQLVLSLYGQLAAGMTPGTFVAGEAASVRPLRGELLPLDVPPAERREQRLVPRDAAAHARPRDARPDGSVRTASSSRSRRRARGSNRENESPSTISRPASGPSRSRSRGSRTGYASGSRFRVANGSAP